MGEPTFDWFFGIATGFRPFLYQCRLACGEPPPDANRSLTEPDEATLQWLTKTQPDGCRSRLIDVPTGLGKTAAVVLAWLWNRVRTVQNAASSRWPRRLVYCLPMRSLVEQTRDSVVAWVENLAKAFPGDSQLRWLRDHSPVVLMGGEEPAPAQRSWDIYPEKPAILIGTQDMLLSRALNRGYAMSRYRWPMHFALLNNDCLWVMDETQLMGVGLETSAQLDAFRHDNRMLVVGACPTWWMSATLNQSRLVTVDHPSPTDGWSPVCLDATDLRLQTVHDRLSAPKRLARAHVSLSAETRKSYPTDLAQLVVEMHRAGSLTLVVLNRVDRAQAVYRALKKLELTDPVALVHSRFRPGDRRAHEAVLHQDGGRIVVATQAIEAGVDVSARTLITELAPWSSLVQRFGRCNRRGEYKHGDAHILWVDIAAQAGGDELAWPYTPEELILARDKLNDLTDAGLQSLRAVSVPEPSVVRPVLRRKDLLELFDTTPDLAGHDLDISRYVRDGDDTDVQVFWRELGGVPPLPQEPQPAPAELCRVSLPHFRDFLDKLRKAADRLAGAATVWTWNPLTEEWQQVRTARAGATYLLDVRVGGYSMELGWTGEPADSPVAPCALPGEAVDRSYSSDPGSQAGVWISLADHTAHVVARAAELAESLVAELAAVIPDTDPSGPLVTAARWHDLGKAHEVFQQMLCGQDVSRRATLWAKSAGHDGRCSRRFFRHELASALAWLQTAPSDWAERDLVAWLIAAHHGKVRLSIRSLPGEGPPPERPDARLARGVLEGDSLPAEAFTAIGVPAPAQPISLSLEVMEMGINPNGEPSWMARMLALRDRFGPFRLAWLETLLRAADAQASAWEIEEGRSQHCQSLQMSAAE